MPRDCAHPAANAPQPGEADDGLDRLRDIEALAVAGLTHGGEGARRAALRLLGWIDAGAPGELEAALGLRSPGWGSSLRRRRLARRDAVLRRLAADHWPNLGATAAATQLRTAWRRAERASLPPVRDPEATLHRLVDEGHACLSVRALRRVLARETAGHLRAVEMATVPSDGENAT